MNTGKTQHEERRIRFAEAGILFVLLLAVAIFVGVKITSQGSPHAGKETTARATNQSADSWAENQLSTQTTSQPHDPPVSESSAGAAGAEPSVATAANPRASDPESALAGDPASPQSRVVSYALAEAAYFEGRYENAVELFTAYTSQKPENAWGFFMLGLSFRKGGDSESAEEALREALVLTPDHLKSLVNLSRVLLDQGRAADALDPAQRAVELAPQNADAYRVLGRVYHNLDKRPEAIEAYREALLRDDEDPWALNNLALLHIENSEFAQALPLLARACYLNENVACFQNNLGMALERTGHVEDAGAAYEAAALDAGYEKAVVNLARVEGRSDGANVEKIDLATLAQEFALEPATPLETAPPAAVELAETSPTSTPIEAPAPQE